PGHRGSKPRTPIAAPPRSPATSPAQYLATSRNARQDGPPQAANSGEIGPSLRRSRIGNVPSPAGGADQRQSGPGGKGGIDFPPTSPRSAHRRGFFEDGRGPGRSRGSSAEERPTPAARRLRALSAGSAEPQR